MRLVCLIFVKTAVHNVEIWDNLNNTGHNIVIGYPRLVYLYISMKQHTERIFIDFYAIVLFSIHYTPSFVTRYRLG